MMNYMRNFSPLIIATWSNLLFSHQDKAREKLVKANGGREFKHGTVVWTSDLAKGDVIERYLPREDYVIQVWCGGYDYWISELLRKGYRVIFSNSDAWYLGRYSVLS